jgi:hypothetical protein
MAKKPGEAESRRGGVGFLVASYFGENLSFTTLTITPSI